MTINIAESIRLRKRKNLKNKIIKVLSARDVCLLTSQYATHSKFIAEILNKDYELIKKVMKELSKEGMVVYENKSYTICDDYEQQEFHKFRNIGWYLTDKARETKIWKTAHKKERKIFNECFKNNN